MTATLSEVKFPVPDFSDVEVAFGAPANAYLTREQMGDDFYSGSHELTRHVSILFFKGGNMVPEGRRWRDGIDRQKAARAIKALLCSFDPKHEIKIGTVGVALREWTEVAQ